MRVRTIAAPILIALVATMGAVLAGDDKPKLGHPLEHAKAGEWAFKRWTSTFDDSSYTNYTYEFIANVDGRKVHRKSQPVLFDGKSGLAPAAEIIVDLDKAEVKDPSAKVVETKEEELLLANMNKKIKTTKTTVTRDDASGKITEATWTSADVPLGGTVKVITLDKKGTEVSRMEVIDFGLSGGAEKPVKATTPPEKKEPEKKQPESKPPEKKQPESKPPEKDQKD